MEHTSQVHEMGFAALYLKVFRNRSEKQSAAANTANERFRLSDCPSHLGQLM